jgi:hypothetical protein
MNQFKKVIRFIREYELEANISCLVVGVFLGTHPIFFFQALGLLVVLGSLFLTVVLIFAASDAEGVEPVGHHTKYVKHVTKKGQK